MSHLLRAHSAAALAVAITLGAGGCAATTPAPPAAPAMTAPAAFSTTDNAWIEISIAMAEEVLPLLDLVPSHGSDSRLKQLSAQVRTQITEELVALRALHAAAGLPARNPHKGMPMPGMVTPGQVTEAAAASGARFDALVREHLAAHLRQSTSLVKSLRKTNSAPPVAAVAERIREHHEFALRELPDD